MGVATRQVEAFEPFGRDAAAEFEAGGTHGDARSATVTRLASARDEVPGPVECAARRASVTDLEIAPEVGASWRGLASGVRQRVAALFDLPCAIAARSFDIEGRLPESFACDLACGGCGFRAAFPTLARRVVEIAVSRTRISVRVACRGEHVGPFFHLLIPTRRPVQFDVHHRLVVGSDNVVKDCVTLDLRSLILQLASIRFADDTSSCGEGIVARSKAPEP